MALPDPAELPPSPAWQDLGFAQGQTEPVPAGEEDIPVEGCVKGCFTCEGMFYLGRDALPVE